jgi:hypothetical protein
LIYDTKQQPGSDSSMSVAFHLFSIHSPKSSIHPEPPIATLQLLFFYSLFNHATPGNKNPCCIDKGSRQMVPAPYHNPTSNIGHFYQ